MTSIHVPLILAFRITIKMAHRKQNSALSSSKEINLSCKLSEPDLDISKFCTYFIKNKI